MQSNSPTPPLITERIHTEGKQRLSILALFTSIFYPASQDEHDRKKLIPLEKTFCSSNTMQVLNQIDPDLVNRSRHVLPKALEAGFRQATKNRKSDNTLPQDILSDDFESLIAEQEKRLPLFKMSILPATGTQLIASLLKVIDQEINRIERKLWMNTKDKYKLADLKKLLLPYRKTPVNGYPVSLQVDVALELLVNILPTLQRKTGLFSESIPSTSFANVRSFLRTQAIFDGDIREAQEKNVKKGPLR